ncbi:hypothetical protein J7T55_003908 [Diaporthe amygdali]|uniref:uncharacterized protein n=1 Tax=Phomopsis amygdali TaxID=1214568 RepID=UPI0022FE5597|nr:uncharacterized protein J7T55_003908 [Diaporthe amygdali]KAJ0117491.1 hypothetical protein J7T55_003908 [Diaporthe amygdali]
MRGEWSASQSVRRRHRLAVERWSLVQENQSHRRMYGHSRKSRRSRDLSGPQHVLNSGLPGEHKLAMVIDLGATSVKVSGAAPAREKDTLDDLVQLAPGNGPNWICLSGGFFSS